MEQKLISVDSEVWRDFTNKVGKGNFSAKIRELINDFNNVPNSETNLSAFYAFKCVADGCKSLGRLSLFEDNNHNRRCLWCGNRAKSTFILEASPFGEVREIPKEEEQKQEEEQDKGENEENGKPDE